MKVNVKSIKMERGGHEDKYIHITVETKEGREFFVLSEAEVRVVCDKWPDYQLVFQDGTHFLSFYENAIVITRPGDREPWHHLYMPVTECFVPHLSVLVNYALDEIFISEAKMDWFKFRFRPIHKIVYRGDAKDLILANLDAQADLRTLKDLVLGLIRIARNNSDGECVTIHINQDGWGNMRGQQGEPPYERPSFYWSIGRADGTRVMNGGIIWHGDEYSVHT